VAYPIQVVNTIRALVERGRCQPLLPVTSNAVAFYNGPEEGFAWLFSSEYAGVDLEAHDSEDWTLLGDAACNFGWWTQLGTEDPAISWQCLYLLRAGGNSHATSCGGKLTPLDTFLRGCTAHHVEHAGKWLEVLSQSGIDLQKYITEEQKIHCPEHLLKASWDEELWQWIPIRQRVMYTYNESLSKIEIWLEDYDALSWFHHGKFDLDIFQVCSPSESFLRWKKINAEEDMPMPNTETHSQLNQIGTSRRIRGIVVVMNSLCFRILIVSLVMHFLVHILLMRRYLI
jgi:hypothetical protein